jgi:hypothetical protein
VETLSQKQNTKQKFWRHGSSSRVLAYLARMRPKFNPKPKKECCRFLHRAALVCSTTPRCTPKRIKEHEQTHLHTHIYGSASHDGQAMESAQVPNNVEYVPNEVLLSHKEELKSCHLQDNRQNERSLCEPK